MGGSRLSATVYLVRHGEVAHHRTDVSLTARGEEQAGAAGRALAAKIAAGDTVAVYHSPVTRVRETADLLYASLRAAFATDGRIAQVMLQAPQPDPALHNARFRLEPGQVLEEPSLVYDQSTDPAYLQRIPPARADFYRGFWATDDHMGYWLTHDSAGGAEPPAAVLARVRHRLSDIFTADGHCSGRTHWIMITHSGTMRAVLWEALGSDPGEPDFCEIATLEPADEPGHARLAYRGRRVRLGIE